MRFITTSESAQFYECGFSCDNAVVLRDSEALFFITDSRYILEAKEATAGVKNIEIIECRDLAEGLLGVLGLLGGANRGGESSGESCGGKIRGGGESGGEKHRGESVGRESSRESLGAFGGGIHGESKSGESKSGGEIIFDPTNLNVELYAKLLPHLNLVPKPRFHQHLRQVKTPREIALIQESQRLNKRAFKRLAKHLSGHLQKHAHGKSEREINFLARQFLCDFGENELSFSPITALNANAAKPHALPTDSRLRKGDLLLFDAGVKFKGYCSDMTRTAYFDGDLSFKKSQKMPPKMQKIYDVVRKAQENAIEKIRAGMSAKEVDNLARSVIEAAGFGAHFTHSLGHGVGLDIHELPVISPRSEAIIEEGMVFSIEPGVYLSGEFGVRIEDLVAIRGGRAEVL